MPLRFICPREGETVTDAAAHFVWSAVPGTKSYTVEYGHAPDFSDARAFNAAPVAEDCRWGALLPKDGDLPGEGAVYARVRADGGEWSQPLSFTVTCARPHAPVRRPIDNAHPYFMIMDYSQHEWRAVWDLLPEDLKPFTSIGTGFHMAGADNDTLREKLMELDGMGIPWHLYVYGPHESDAGHYSCVPLADCEYLMAHAKHLVSVNMVEQYLGRRTDDYGHAVYMRRLIALCGKYGMAFVYSDGNRNNFEMTGFFSGATARVMREYAPYCTVQYKQNHSHSAHTVYGALLGAWESGICANIGVQAENWYWNDAGYRGEFGESAGYLQGVEQQIPCPFSVEMLLAGAAIGGCCYTLEGQGWLLECEDGKKPRFSPHGIGILSLLRFLAEHRAIPDKEDVLGSLRAFLSTDKGAIEQGDAWTGGIWKNAFTPSWRGSDEYALFMKESRYGALPIANPFTRTTLPVYRAEGVADPDTFRRALDGLFPVRFQGNCFIALSSRTLIVMNSRENALSGQYFDVPLPFGPVRRIAGGLSTWQYAVLCLKGGAVRMLAGGPDGSDAEFRVYAAPGARCVCAEGASVIANTEDGFVLRLRPDGSPARCAVTDGAGASFSPRIASKGVPGAEWLSDLPFSRVEADGPFLPARDKCANTRFGDMPLYMNGMTYVHGVSFCPGTRVSWKTGGRYKGLALHYGYDIDAWMPRLLDRERIVWDRYPHSVALVFRILGDGRELYASPLMRNTYVGARVCLDIRGVDTLTFCLEGEVKARGGGDAVFFDVVNPRLLGEKEYAAALAEKDPEGVVDAAFGADMAENFRPQVQDSSDLSGPMRFYPLDE